MPDGRHRVPVQGRQPELPQHRLRVAGGGRAPGPSTRATARSTAPELRLPADRVDGQVPGGGGTDKFRIKIWDKNQGDAIVDHNEMTSTDDAPATTVIAGVPS